MTDTLRKAAEAATEYAGYSVDESGNVWSTHIWRGVSKRSLKPFPNSHGYLTVKVKDGDRMKKAFIHKMVCVAFHGPKPTPAHEVRHLDGNRTNNHANNLQWGTKKENAQDRKIHGREMAAANGRQSAWKALGRINPYCLRGHHKGGRRSCNTCRNMQNRAKQNG
jgi:hypothetical protein